MPKKQSDKQKDVELTSRQVDQGIAKVERDVEHGENINWLDRACPTSMGF